MINGAQTDYSRNIYCQRCRLLLGFRILKFKVNVELDMNKQREIAQSFYFLKRKVKIRKAKNMEINYISLKDNYLQNIVTEFEEISKDAKNYGFNINNTLHKKEKDNLDTFICKKRNSDINFIIHKIEGRVFLLGKNGFYNKIVEAFKNKMNQNIYFILIYQNISEEPDSTFLSNLLDSLIFQGQQHELNWFKENGHIIFLNDFNLKEDFKQKKNIFRNILYKSYDVLGEDEVKDKANFSLCPEVLLQNDLLLIEKAASEIYNGEIENIFSKCNMI